MLLAIDLGNSETDFGVWAVGGWRAVWRRRTSELGSSEELGEWLEDQLESLEPSVRLESGILSTVVPAATDIVERAVERVAGIVPERLWAAPELGMPVRYDPPSSLGTDRLANALAARRLFAPVIVVDVGTATTFEAVDGTGVFVGGAIMPGPGLAAAALAAGTAALPEAALEAPGRAIGASTAYSLRSGIMLGHAAAIQGLAERMADELGGATVIATGGLGERFLALCPILRAYYPTLTLDGLVEAATRMQIWPRDA